MKLLKQCETSWNTRTPIIWCDNIVGPSGDVGAQCGDVGDRAELLAISARGFGDIGDWGVGVTSQMCNRVTNHGDMGTFSRPAWWKQQDWNKKMKQRKNARRAEWMRKEIGYKIIFRVQHWTRKKTPVRSLCLGTLSVTHRDSRLTAAVNSPNCPIIECIAWMPYELIWAHISCYSCRFMYYITM